MPQVGLYSVLAGAVSAWAGAALALWRPKSARLLRGAQALTAAFCAAGFFILMVLVARADARVVYAVEHAAPKDAALGYRLAAVWAGQAGGLLLWAFEAAVVALFLRPAAMPRAVGVLLAIEGCLLGMVAMDNPFGPPQPGATGGMNPMLLHPMMLIHPPMLFLGYALLAVPYAVTVGALLDRRPDTWPQQVRPWVLVGWLALTAGNGFGAEWAYKTFGWSGFWAWDPVENTSFVPWVLAAVTVHCLWLAQRDDRWLPPAAVTAMASFLTVLYGSYLARSGALAGASVHAYVAGERLMQYALLTVLLGAAAVGASVMVARWGSWRKWTLYEVVSAAGVPVWETFPVASDSAAVEGAGGAASVSRGAPGGRESDAREASGEEEAYGATREVATGWCVGAMAVIAALVLAGMSLPMAGLSPSPTLYNTVLLPVAVAIVALMTRMAAPRLTDRARSWLLAIAAFVSVGGIAMAVQYGAGLERGWLMAVQALCAPVLVVFCALAMLWSAWRFFAGRRPLRQRGASLAHFGVAALLAGAAFSGYGTTSEKVYLVAGEEQHVMGHLVSVMNVSRPSREVSRAEIYADGRIGMVEIEQNQSFEVELRRAYIRRGLLRDLYITPHGILTEPTQIGKRRVPPGAMVEVAVKPGMFLVWLGMLCIAGGIVLSIWRRRQAAKTEYPEADKNYQGAQ